MNRAILGFLMLASTVAFTGPACAGPTQDEAQVREVATQQGDAWNRHDAKAYAGLFTEGADLVNVVGWWWKGRAEIERKLTVAYAHMFKDSTLTITEVQVRFLAPQIAVAHARWTMVGAKPPPGVPEPREGLQTLILKKHAGHWLIDVFQNTNAIPEAAFAPPAEAAKRRAR